jgi:peptidoglycan lytic transglycosylase
MRSRIAQGLTMALLVGLGAAQGTTSSGSAIHDAVKEAITRTAPSAAPVNTRPYQVGTASWYGEYFVGKPTASGEPYDMFQLTAAHPKLPLGTLVKVTNLRNRRSVIVRINDRGPVVPGRIIDISYSAATVLNFKTQGLQRVRLDLVFSPKRAQIAMLREPNIGR